MEYVPSAPETSKVPMAPLEPHVLLVVCRVAVFMSRVAQWPSHHAPSVGTQLQMCVLMLKSSHRPDRRWVPCLTCPNRLSSFNLDPSLFYQGYVRASHTCKLQWEKCLRACPDSRLENCERFGQLQWVRATETLKTSHGPNGKTTDVLASTLARTPAAHTLVNYSLMYVLQRP